MGSSVTVPVIGRTKLEDERWEEVFAMSKLDMAQKRRLMEKAGKPIWAWYAQTAHGCRLLGTVVPGEEILDKDVRHVKTVTCPICGGKGRKYLPKPGVFPEYRSCPVCSGSGITRKGYEKRWRDWQVEMFREMFNE